MNHGLAKTLTTALVQWIDKERQEGTMCCSSDECEKLVKAFEGGCYDVVQEFLNTKLTRLTAFEKTLAEFVNDVLAKEPHNPFIWIIGSGWVDKLLALAKEQFLSYADESNPKIEAMADLERTYFCNPDKLPKWLKDDIARKELNAHTKGYNKGYKDAEKQYNESVAYHFPTMPTPPSGWGCDGTHCTNPHHDCINCPVKCSSGGTITTPNTASGTSAAALHGNTSVTDGKEHNPSFID